MMTREFSRSRKKKGNDTIKINKTAFSKNERVQKKIRHGQVSTEYLFLLGMILIIFIPVIIYSFGKTNQELRDAQLEELMLKLQQSANTMHLLGTSNQETIDVHIPSNVAGIVMNNRKEIVLQITTPLSGGPSTADISIPTYAYMVGQMDAKKGLHRAVVWAFNESHVRITDVINQ